MLKKRKSWGNEIGTLVNRENKKWERWNLSKRGIRKRGNRGGGFVRNENRKKENWDSGYNGYYEKEYWGKKKFGKMGKIEHFEFL